MNTLSKSHFMLFVVVFVCLSSSAYSQEKASRSLSWTLDNRNDPILQVKNESQETATIEVRLMIGDESYRFPEDLVVPSGESRFLRVREALERLGRKYRHLLGMNSGTLQIQHYGDSGQIESSIVNLNPKMGVTSEKALTTQPTPIIRSIDPVGGPPSGGTVVTIVGENFSDASVVKFGGVAAMRTRQSNEVLIAIAPQHSAGTVEVEVSNGRRGTTLGKAFTYAVGGPVVARLEPDTGAPAGGSAVRIIGRNFQPDTRVIWDRRSLAARYISPDELMVTAPPGPRGSIAIEVSNPDGERSVLEDAYHYMGGPRVTSVQPNSGSRNGGYSVTVNGDDFDPGCSVLFGGNYGQTTFINPRALAAIVPPGDSGTVDVTVSTEEGETDTLEYAFIYNEPPLILSVTAYPNPIVRNTTTTIRVDADDPEAGPLEYEYRVAQGPGTITGQGRTAIFASPNITGIAVIQVTVYDQHRARAQQNLEIFVE